MASVQGLTHPVTTFLAWMHRRPISQQKTSRCKTAAPHLTSSAAANTTCRHRSGCRGGTTSSTLWPPPLRAKAPGYSRGTRPGPFTGAGRRFEHKGNYNGAEVYDDYAHHPGELHALLTTAKTLGYRRILCAFSAAYLFPHQSAVPGIRGRAEASGHSHFNGDLCRPGNRHAGHLFQRSGRRHSRCSLLQNTG